MRPLEFLPNCGHPARVFGPGRPSTFWLLNPCALHSACRRAYQLPEGLVPWPAADASVDAFPAVPTISENGKFLPGQEVAFTSLCLFVAALDTDPLNRPAPVLPHLIAPAASSQYHNVRCSRRLCCGCCGLTRGLRQHSAAFPRAPSHPCR